MPAAVQEASPRRRARAPPRPRAGRGRRCRRERGAARRGHYRPGRGPLRRSRRPRSRARHRLLRDQSGLPLGGRGRSLRQPAERLLAAAPRRRLHAETARSGRPAQAPDTATASRTRPTGRRAAPATSARETSPGRPSGSSGSPASCTRGCSRSWARRPTRVRSAGGRNWASRSAGWATRCSSSCPSTSPANAAVSYPERLRWFRTLASLEK